MKFLSRLAATSLVALSAMLTAQPVLAQASAPVGDDSGIIVTAQRREEKQRDVPISITTLNPQQLQTANVTTLSDITKLTPALRFDAAGSNVQPSIRGVGTAIATSGAGPNVGIYVDGFFQSNPAVADFQLLKVQSIQVLEGPQGTLFGRNTTGGAILVTTADPSSETSGEIKLSYASFNSLKAQAHTTFGLTKNIAMDIEGIYHSGDGYVRNLIPKVGDGRFVNWSVRSGIKANLSSNVSVLLRFTHSVTDDPSPLLTNAYVDTTGGANYLSSVTAAGRATYGIANTTGRPLVYFYTPAAFYATAPGTINSSERPVFKNTSDSVQGTIKADLGFANLTSYSQFRRDRTVNRQELGETAFPSFYIYIGVDDATISQEFLLSSKAGTPLQWTAGVNYYQSRDTWDVRAALAGSEEGPFGGSSTTTKSTAVFADLTYQLSDQIFVTVGGRYSHDVVGNAYFKTNQFTPFTGYTGPNGQNIPFAGAAGTVIPVKDLANDSFTPRAVIRYKPSDNSSIYASFTRGFKAGILNVGGLSQLPVKPETINAYEIGYKYGDRSLSVDLAGFYYDYKNLQVSSYQFGAAIINNAASSEIYGLEGQLAYRVSEDFKLNANVSYTHARYKSFPGAPYYNFCDPAAVSGDLLCVQGAGTLAQTTINASGYHVQRSPDFTASIGAEYGMDLGRGRLNLSGNLFYSSAFYFDPVQQFKQEGYEVLSLRAQWVDASKRYTVAVFGDNVTGRRYKTQVLANTVGVGNTWSPPATWGVTVGTKF